MYMDNEIAKAELMHFGIPGMKWGVRKAKELSGNEKTYRKKLSNIRQNSNVNASDLKRFEYRDQNIYARAGKTAAKLVVGQAVRAALTGNLSRYAKMSKTQIAKEALNLALRTGVSVASQDALAKSASKRYQNNGQKVSGKKDHIMTKEDAIELGVRTATAAIAVARIVGPATMRNAAKKRYENERRVKKWGSNLLSDKVSSVTIWSDDNVSVIQPLGKINAKRVN